jgi:hypothetical protein
MLSKEDKKMLTLWPGGRFSLSTVADLYLKKSASAWPIPSLWYLDLVPCRTVQPVMIITRGTRAIWRSNVWKWLRCVGILVQ